MNAALVRALVKAVPAALLVLGAAGAFGQSLPDPTRPPDALNALNAANKQEPAGAQSGPVLQSVLVSPRRKLAVISGQTVKLGGEYENARVVKISETEVVLRNGKDTRTLKLFPQAEKQSVSGQPRGKAGDRPQESATRQAR